MLPTQNQFIDENRNIMEEIDNGIFRVDNQKKKRRRVKLIILFILISILIWSELLINFHCIKENKQYTLLSLDIACYAGLMMIVLFEIFILCLKLRKQKKNQKRIRSRFGNIFLYIYMTLIGIIIALLIDHTFWQMYYAVSHFGEECFYFEGELKQKQKWFYLIKIMILIIFFAIECFAFYFLVQVLKKSLLTLREPKRRSHHIFRSQSNDIVVFNSLNNQLEG